VKSRTGTSEEVRKKIVRLVRSFRKEGEGIYKHTPTIRESVKIARALKVKHLKPSKKEPFFRMVCLHALTNEPHPSDSKGTKATKLSQLLNELIERYG